MYSARVFAVVMVFQPNVYAVELVISLREPPVRLLPLAYRGLFCDLIRHYMKDSAPPPSHKFLRILNSLDYKRLRIKFLRKIF